MLQFEDLTATSPLACCSAKCVEKTLPNASVKIPSEHWYDYSQTAKFQHKCNRFFGRWSATQGCRPRGAVRKRKLAS